MVDGKNRCAILVLQAAEIIFKEEKAMRFFVDTADVEEIRKANDMGVICGVTTNPSLIAKSGRKFEDVIKEITSISHSSEYGRKDPHDGRRLKGSQGSFLRGYQDQCDADLFCKPGASGSPGRCNLRISVPWKN